jgi:hypothetical protein
MLFYAIGMMIVGVILIKRGNGYVQQAAQCDDREEKAALEALGNRTRIWGVIAFCATLALFMGFLFLLGA